MVAFLLLQQSCVDKAEHIYSLAFYGTSLLTPGREGKWAMSILVKYSFSQGRPFWGGFWAETWNVRKSPAWKGLGVHTKGIGISEAWRPEQSWRPEQAWRYLCHKNRKRAGIPRTSGAQGNVEWNEIKKKEAGLDTNVLWKNLDFILRQR